jgi:hypothetical protein
MEQKILYKKHFKHHKIVHPLANKQNELQKLNGLDMQIKLIHAEEICVLTQTISLNLSSLSNVH